MATRNTKANETQATIDALTAEADRCLAELRTMPRTRRFRDRRAWVQRRIAEIGEDMRKALGFQF